MVLNTHGYLWLRKVSMVWGIPVGIFEAIEVVLLVDIRQITHIFHYFSTTCRLFIWYQNRCISIFLQWMTHLKAYKLSLKYILVVQEQISASERKKEPISRIYCVIKNDKICEAFDVYQLKVPSLSPKICLVVCLTPWIPFGAKDLHVRWEPDPLLVVFKVKIEGQNRDNAIRPR